MSDSVNKVRTKDGSLYDIHDARIPEVSSEDAGKVFKVDSEGHIILE